MKKTTKTLIVLLAVLVILVGGLAAVKFLNRDSSEEESAEEYTLLFSALGEDITEISYTRGEETVTLIKNGTDWTIKGSEDLPLDTSLLETMTAELAEVKLYKKIDSDEDFGFESDGIEITVRAGQTCHFVLGMENSQIGKAYLLTDTSEIYTTETSLRDAFPPAVEDLLLADDIPEIDASDILRMEVTGSDSDYTILLEEEQSFYYAYRYSMENALGSTPLDTTYTQSFLQASSGLYLTCVDYTPDASVISAAGFDTPITLSFRYTTETEDGEEQENTYSIYLGAEYTDPESSTAYRYLMLEDSEMLFRITKPSADNILLPDLSQLAPAEICEMSFSQIKEFSFTLNGESHSSVREKQDEETVCYYDGKEINYGYVESFFLDLTTMLSEGGYPEELPAEKPIVTANFVLAYNETEAEFTLDIYEYNANFCIAAFSGRQDLMLVSTRDVNALAESLSELKKNAAR